MHRLAVGIGRRRCTDATARTWRRGLGAGRAAAAQAASWREVKRSSHDAARHDVDPADRGAVATPARTLRQLAGCLRPLQPLAQGRHLRQDHQGASDQAELKGRSTGTCGASTAPASAPPPQHRTNPHPPIPTSPPPAAPASPHHPRPSGSRPRSSPPTASPCTVSSSSDRASSAPHPPPPR